MTNERTGIGQDGGKFADVLICWCANVLIG